MKEMLNENGLTVKTVTQIRDELEAQMKLVFGQNINLTPETPDGMELSIRADQFYQQGLLLQQVYDTFRVDSVEGEQQDSLYKLNYLTRIQASVSTVKITLTGTHGTIIPKGLIVSDTSNNNGVKFKTTAQIMIPTAGYIDVLASSIETGPIQAKANTLTHIINPINGLSSVTNKLDADLGENRETDSEFRARRTLSVQREALYSTDAMWATIMQVPNVKEAYVRENDTKDPIGKQPANTTWAIVEGGLDQDVAEAIAKRKMPGIPTFGSVSKTVNDIQGLPHTVKFTRPTKMNISVKVVGTIYDREVFPQDGVEQVKQAIYAMASKAATVGADVYYSRVFQAAIQVPGYDLTDLKIGVDTASSDANIVVDIDELAVFDLSRINVTIA